ncbi:methylamine utilization protein [Polaribacter reichenbachii]|uniref:Methylamine utilization protein n=1 Tax=Polaribacter reichenbachii TaxID=996801 RepID=A0A1B8TUC2_9FLAO|nr:cytochrome c peroxidase [Polaribacter reichenbachii]APZ45722.1 methylamine utilization protein [Polaribacter reichenbachii]AUC19583.1 methylamine utilization protein [Polaribacter reichenbachii]OBY63263.1 methylamine utilization protein [Polaribacter reichenbachii]
MNTILFNIRAKAYTFCICLLLLSMVACKKSTTQLKPISKNKQIEHLYVTELQHTISALDSLLVSEKTIDKIKFYKQARHHFKTLEPILAFVDKSNYKSLNAPNILQVHEDVPTDIKVNNPFGFQVIEELLHEDKIDTLTIKNIATITISRLKLLKQNAYIKFKDYHLVWLLRNQIVRIATTGITGFDSPVLAASLQESILTYKTLLKLLALYKGNFTSEDLYQKIVSSIETSIKNLDHPFDTFDRYSFIKNNTDVQLKLLLELQKDWAISYPFEMALSNNMQSLFSKDAFNVYFFTDYKSDTTHIKEKEQLGKKLFNDKRLSKLNNMACASCHMKEKAFTDGLVTFNSKIKRNSPTLTYSAYQQSYFMDAKTGSLEGQIVGVANNHDEFNLPIDKMAIKITEIKEYKIVLDSLYKNDEYNFNIRHSIASYIRTLNTFDSKFDKNINNKENNLTASEKKGFNLFMGKAACATCHFAPVFNGTVPPDFVDTELEIIGVPETKNNKKLDDDLGRFYLFNTPERKGSFKTPTVRNIEKTAPYMHNGIYSTLDEVMDFYNKGGGAGLGFNVPHQTLPFDNLDLKEDEITAIIDFMNTLSDQ